MRMKQGLSSVSSPEGSGRLNLDFSHLGEKEKDIQQEGEECLLLCLFSFLFCFLYFLLNGNKKMLNKQGV